MELRAGDARLLIDEGTGILREITLANSRHALLTGISSLFDLALPLPDNLPHRIHALDGHRVTGITQVGEEYQFRSAFLESEQGRFDIDVTLKVRPRSDGRFALNLFIVNHSAHTIPQVLFPHLAGLRATEDPKHEELHLGRATRRPHVWMQSPDDAASFYDLYRRWYFVYGMQEWCMKWFNLGNARRGIAVFSTDAGVPLQGLSVERDKRHPILTVSWAHYPHIPPGDSWTSPEIILDVHAGDWRVGLDGYKQQIAAHLPTVNPTKYIEGSLGARSLYFSTYLYDSEPNFRYRDLPVAARDAKAHGLKELICWFLFDAYFELPMKLNPKLGTELELRAAIAECRALGVNVVAFVSCRSLKTRSAPNTWFETDEHGNRRTQAWSYSLDFVPVFNPPYCNRDESAFACPAAGGFRDAFRSACAALHQSGFSSICFDQLFADRLCYARSHRHHPAELLGPLYGVMKEVLAHGQRVDPDATLSGEFFNDVSQTFQHYNWDWITGANPLQDLEPFRLAFPRYRLGLLVDRSRRWLLEGFARGLFLNFLPEGGEGLIDTDREFSDLTRELAGYRHTYARFFEEGEYLGTVRPAASAPLASLYRYNDELLLIVVNTANDEAEIESGSMLHTAMYEAAIPLPAYGYHLFHWRIGQSPVRI
jgi:hypothetical protein